MQHSRTLPDLAHRTFGRFSQVGTEPFLDPADFPWTALLEEHYLTIRAEAERGAAGPRRTCELSGRRPGARRTQRRRPVEDLLVLRYEVWDDPNCVRCPVTAAVLRAIPGLTTGFFSILGPGKRLPPHYGLYRAVLTTWR